MPSSESRVRTGHRAIGLASKGQQKDESDKSNASSKQELLVLRQRGEVDVHHGTCALHQLAARSGKCPTLLNTKACLSMISLIHALRQFSNSGYLRACLNLANNDEVLT